MVEKRKTEVEESLVANQNLEELAFLAQERAAVAQKQVEFISEMKLEGKVLMESQLPLQSSIDKERVLGMQEQIEELKAKLALVEEQLVVEKTKNNKP